jgi:5-(carboxyamino)imidazole ribonucleotide synthase
MMSKAFYSDLKIGVLGGGQLGRMMIQAAIDLNLDIHVLDPDKNAPCKSIASTFQVGKLTDYQTVYDFGKQCDLITIEIENVNTAALKNLAEEGKLVYPQPRIIEMIQDKRQQKIFYQDHRIPTAPFVLTENREDVKKHPEFLPAVHKLGREGYDGRGVQKITSPRDLELAFDQPGLLEKLIDFEKEISVLVARNLNGEMAVFPVVELVFHPEHNLVEYLFSPAEISDQVREKAESIAKGLIQKLDMVGLLAVEMFVTRDEEVLVNEIAPRTHNSGHQTIESNYTSQFKQHLRAILNLPLGATHIKIPSAMVNLLGESGYTGVAKYEGLEKILALDGAYVHLYGKKYTKPYRKMGHVTIIDHDMKRLKEKAMFVKENLKVIA